MVEIVNPSAIKKPEVKKKINKLNGSCPLGCAYLFFYGKIPKKLD